MSDGTEHELRHPRDLLDPGLREHLRHFRIIVDERVQISFRIDLKDIGNDILRSSHLDEHFMDDCDLQIFASCVRFHSGRYHALALTVYSFLLRNSHRNMKSTSEMYDASNVWRNTFMMRTDTKEKKSGLLKGRIL